MWRKSCGWARPRLALLAGDDLPGLERRRIERHLIVCPDCRAYVANLRSVLDVLRVVGEQAPVSPDAPSLWPALAREMRESRRPVPAWPLAWGWPAAGLAASLLVAAGVTLALRPGAKPPLVQLHKAQRQPAPVMTVSHEQEPGGQDVAEEEEKPPRVARSSAEYPRNQLPPSRNMPEGRESQPTH